VCNKNSIGLDDAGYKALWDADDPLEIEGYNRSGGLVATQQTLVSRWQI